MRAAGAVPKEQTQPSGPEGVLEKVLAAFEVATPQQLLENLPRAYHIPGVSNPDTLADGSPVTFVGAISGEYRTSQGRKLGSVNTWLQIPGIGSVLLQWVSHPSRLKAKQIALQHAYPPGHQVLVSGRWETFGDPRNPRAGISNPDIQRVTPELMAASGAGRVVLPVYRLPGKLRADEVRQAMRLAWAEARFETKIPGELLPRLSDMDLAEAYAMLHGFRSVPGAEQMALMEGASRYHRRVEVERLWEIMTAAQPRAGTPRAPIAASTHDLRSGLPFQLTAGQAEALDDVEADLAAGRPPRRRLVQGDVGSGKSVVAYLTATSAVRAGSVAALMAPTDILAEQLLSGVRAIAEPAGVKTIYLSGKSRAAERRKAVKAAESGVPTIFVGTHAIASLDFKDLGVLVIDEEQRFGVGVKDRLMAYNPHVITMSATPIPRSLAHVVYAGQAVSVIKTRPEGRSPVGTKLVEDADGRQRLLDYMRQAFSAGRQAFVVCPSIASEEMADVESVAAWLVEELGAEKVRVVHGDMPDKEAERVLNAFRAGEFACLVSTSIIEVGINVPNATLMAIMDPHRMGLAQLHQIRGRVGRGEHRGYCALVLPSTRVSDKAMERLTFFCRCHDGFELAEKDMLMRGSGDLGGTAQSGFLDVDIIKLANEAALISDFLEKQPVVEPTPTPVVNLELAESQPYTPVF